MGMYWYVVRDYLGDDDAEPCGHGPVETIEDTRDAVLAACRQDYDMYVADGRYNNLDRGARIAEIYDNPLCNGSPLYEIEPSDAAELDAVAEQYDDGDAIGRTLNTITYLAGEIEAYRDVMREAGTSGNTSIAQYARNRLNATLGKLMHRTDVAVALIPPADGRAIIV